MTDSHSILHRRVILTDCYLNYLVERNTMIRNILFSVSKFGNATFSFGSIYMFLFCFKCALIV